MKKAFDVDSIKNKKIKKYIRQQIDESHSLTQRQYQNLRRRIEKVVPKLNLDEKR